MNNYQLDIFRQMTDGLGVPRSLSATGGILLGPDYQLNPHRHCHLNPPGSKGQTWHKDCYVFDHNMRQPRFHWL